MSINATLLVQMLTFGLFVLFTMKLVWPHIMTALNERQKSIADGLAAAEKSKRDLEFAERKIVERTREVKIEAAEIIERANKQANQIVEDAKSKAREEAGRLLALAQTDIEKEVQGAKVMLRKQIGLLAVEGAERILKKSIDNASNEALVADLIDEI